MPDPAYRAAPPGALRVEPLGELTAIFDRRSMQTHLVVSPMPEILAAMGADDCDAATLAARLARSFDFDGAGEVLPILAERLAELAAMGLVARA
ncbi:MULTISPECIES: HPr-rel-A system PqqD family peptide chaperone [unclassified Sphingopyxis]|jgi:PqqD family protein of HPr-rel-A system|uniref:HPr-rel-A system PqqD family peptide chaperone n=1 Tax=unclassified Sphingopyxis TaxID=2614943 RepID=UPI00285CF596|nr:MULTISPECIES: HPr-rel-A system PqqD family peptide chaperone [unclassified Sphingopyxis]MDR6835046.1 PqqD family protein of HPr-rel-A system [Sphingopyxis sp. BE122]MDR7227317.1 PqqD family protein of HPr-rel-A system [Sphingopyxis sp. BE259]